MSARPAIPLAFALALVTLGCGADEPVACPDTCDCPAGSTCEFACGADGCRLAECVNASCTGTCTGGRCNLDCEMGSCQYDCPGGLCTSDCDLGSDCAMSCAGGGCQVVCDAASSCTLDCTDAPTPCNVLCEAGGVATCLGNCETPGCG